MGKICIEVSEYNKDELVKWFRDIHVDSKIDFWENNGRFYLWNGEKELLVDNINTNKFKSELYKNDLFFLKDYYRYTDIDRFGVSWERKKIIDFYCSLPLEKIKETSCIWNISNISLKQKEEENYLVEYVEIDIQQENEYEYSDHQNLKYEWEQKLADKYCCCNSERDCKVELPLYYERTYNIEQVKELLFHMLFYLKEKCLFGEIDELSMLTEYIQQVKYSNLLKGETRVILQPRGEIAYPLVPEDVVTEFAPEMTVGILMKLMGVYRHAQREEELPQIVICRDNIILAIRNMLYKDGFRDKFVTPIEIKINKAEEEAIFKIDSILEKMVVAHECGHHVFRKLHDKLSINEREALANWFASIILEDSYSYRLSLFLVQYQTAEYHDFIKIPSLYHLKEESYKDYCDKIYDLVGGLW